MAAWVSLAIITGIIVIAMLRVRSRRKKPATSMDAKKPFQSVSVKWGPKACGAVRKLDGQRFIGSESPGFPLPDCDAEQCKCRYEFHSDRRDGDRRMLHGMRHSLIVINSSEDKRAQVERRGHD